MARYEPVEPADDNLKITAAALTLEDGSTVSIPVPEGDDYYIVQTKTTITAAALAAGYVAHPLA